MNIRLASMEDFDTISHIYKRARSFMAEHGNPSQWGTNYPSDALIMNDIQHSHAYVCVDSDAILAVFYYAFEEDDTYRTIYDGNWLNEQPYGVVHRIASSGTVKGTASFCLEWALSQCRNLKIDTHRENLVMQNLLVKLGFTKCGTILVEDGSKRIAFQKQIFQK